MTQYRTIRGVTRHQFPVTTSYFPSEDLCPEQEDHLFDCQHSRSAGESTLNKITFYPPATDTS
jgi:hypothetical protein